jgi:hypothetical protein
MIGIVEGEGIVVDDRRTFESSDRSPAIAVDASAVWRIVAVRVEQSIATDFTSSIVKTFDTNREQSSRSESRNVDSSRIRIVPAVNEIGLGVGGAGVSTRRLLTIVHLMSRITRIQSFDHG